MPRSLARSLLLLPASIFLGWFFFYPLARILLLGLDLASLTAPDIHLSLEVLSFTFFQAGLSTLLTLLLGLPAAFLFSRYKFSGSSALRTLTAIPFMLPTVVVAAGFNAWLGPRGWLNLLLRNLFDLDAPPIPFLGTLGAILIAHLFYNTTIVIRMLSSTLRRLDPDIEEAAQSLGAGPTRLFWRVTLPLLRPSLLAAALLVFLFDFTSFGVILLLGGPGISTLEVEIYNQAVGFYDLSLSAWLSLVQLACTLFFSILYSRVVGRPSTAGQPRSNDPRPATSWRGRLFVGGLGMLLLIFYALPMASLPLRSLTRLEADLGQRSQVDPGPTLAYYAELFVNRRASVFYVPPASALGNSLAYASLTVVLSLALGLPAAASLAHPGRIERLIDPLLILPLGASAVTLGLGFIVAFSEPPFSLPFLALASPLLVPIVHTIVALPFVIRVLQPALSGIPERLRQAAVTLGASPLRVWQRVDWPIARRAVLSAAVFAFTISLGEFGATSLVYRPEFPTLPMAIYRFLSLPGGSNYGQAMAMATVLMLVTGAGILAIEKLRLPGAGEF